MGLFPAHILTLGRHLVCRERFQIVKTVTQEVTLGCDIAETRPTRRVPAAERSGTQASRPFRLFLPNTAANITRCNYSAHASFIKDPGNQQRAAKSIITVIYIQEYEVNGKNTSQIADRKKNLCGLKKILLCLLLHPFVSFIEFVVRLCFEHCEI